MSAHFDPAECDHGAELMGRTEFDWCKNCDPLRASVLELTGFDPGPTVRRKRLAPVGAQK